MRTPLAASALIVVLAAAPSAVYAQQPAGAHAWSSFFGCWTPGRTATGTASVQRCVLPGADDREARFATYNGDTLVVEETMIANGLPQGMKDKDCTGERTVRWSQNGQRFFYRTTSSCAGSPRPSTSGIAALVAADQWLDVQAATAAGREQVRVVRYWRSEIQAPAPIADAVVRLLHPIAPRVAPATVDDVIEASREVTPGAVEAWLAESGVRLPLDRRTLIQLDEGHVHPRVIDLLVAQAYPKKFVVHAGGSSSSSSVGSLFVSCDPWFDPSSSNDFYAMEYGRFSAPFYFGWGTFYRPYDAIDTGGANQGGGGGGNVGSEAHGQAVNGQGYTRVQPREPVGAPVNRGQAAGASGSGTAADAGSGGGGAGDSGGGSSSGASPAGYSGGGGTSTGLTAVPR